MFGIPGYSVRSLPGPRFRGLERIKSSRLGDEGSDGGVVLLGVEVAGDKDRNARGQAAETVGKFVSLGGPPRVLFFDRGRGGAVFLIRDIKGVRPGPESAQEFFIVGRPGDEMNIDEEQNGKPRPGCSRPRPKWIR